MFNMLYVYAFREQVMEIKPNDIVKSEFYTECKKVHSHTLIGYLNMLMLV